MKRLTGVVKGGFGVGAQNMAHVMHLIEQRTGLKPLVRGTLNLALAERYVVVADARIEPHEYRLRQLIKLQRCRVGDLRALIMRPFTHEIGYGHGPAHLEILATCRLRERFGLMDGDTVEVEIGGDDAWWRDPA